MAGAELTGARTCVCFYLNCKLDAIRDEAARDEAFSEWEEMFALNGSTPYGNEISAPGIGPHEQPPKYLREFFPPRLRLPSF